MEQRSTSPKYIYNALELTMLLAMTVSSDLSSRLMQNPLGAAFARKVLRCKARDEGRTLVLFDESCNAAAGHFSCKPFGAVLGGARRSGRAKETAQRRRATRSR